MKKSTLITALISLILLFAASNSSAASCQNSDVTANLSGGGSANASYCINQSGNDGSGVTFATQMNGLFNGEHSTSFAYTWTQLAKDDAIGALDASSGAWDFSSYSLTNPFVIVLKAANSFAAYLFIQDGSGTGTFNTINVTNATNAKGVSHISLYTTVGEVPIPAAVFLFAPALLGFLGLRRKKRA